MRQQYRGQQILGADGRNDAEAAGSTEERPNHHRSRVVRRQDPEDGIDRFLGDRLPEPSETTAGGLPCLLFGHCRLHQRHHRTFGPLRGHHSRVLISRHFQAQRK